MARIIHSWNAVVKRVFGVLSGSSAACPSVPLQAMTAGTPSSDEASAGCLRAPLPRPFAESGTTRRPRCVTSTVDVEDPARGAPSQPGERDAVSAGARVIRLRLASRVGSVVLIAALLSLVNITVATPAHAGTVNNGGSELAVPASGTTRSGAYVAGWEATIDHDVYYLTSFTSPFDQPWEPQHEVEFAHRQGSAMFMYLEIPRDIESIARGDHDVAIAAWFERWCEVAWVNRDVVAPLAEMNGDWTVWNGIGRADTYREAYRRVQSLAPCHVRWAYAPSAFRGWDRYYPGDEAGRIVFIAPSVFAWSCVTTAEWVVEQAAAMRRHFGRPTILAQTGTACAEDRSTWYADLFAHAAALEIFAVIPGHFPNGGQPHEPWDNEGWAWALQYTENSARLQRKPTPRPVPVVRVPRVPRAFVTFL